MSIVKKLRSFLPFPKDDGFRKIMLVGGPVDGFELTIPVEMWDKGEVMVEAHPINHSPGGQIVSQMPAKVLLVAYRRKGRDNAAFEYAGNRGF